MRRITQRLCLKHEVPFIHVEDLGEEFTDEDFRDLSHLNLGGATKLTRVLARLAVIPALKEEAPWRTRLLPEGERRAVPEEDAPEEEPGEIIVPEGGAIDDQ
jgi:hypothetical protein